MKYFISLNTVASSLPTVLPLENGGTMSNPYDIVNTCNNYFASIAETMKKSINIYINIFHLSNETSSTIFLQPADKEEITNIIFSLQK